MLTKRERNREEFFANRRSKRPKKIYCDPEAEFEAMKAEKKFNEDHPPDPAKKAVVKSAIDYLCVQLRIRKIAPEYHRNNKQVNFFYFNYVSIKYCYSGYITIWTPSQPGVKRIYFTISDGRDLIEKLIRYGVLDKKFL